MTSCSLLRRSFSAPARLVKRRGSNRRETRLAKRRPGEKEIVVEEEIIPTALRDVETASDFLEYALFRMRNPSKFPSGAYGKKQEGGLPTAIDSLASVLGVSWEDIASKKTRRDKLKLRERYKDDIAAKSGKSKSSVSSSSSSTKKEITFSFGQMTSDVEEDMRYLVCEYLGIPGLSMSTGTRRAMEERFLTPREILSLDSLLDKRIRRFIPVAYLLRRAYFQGMKLYVNNDVMIPRSFIGEVLVNIEDRHKEATRMWENFKNDSFPQSDKNMKSKHFPIELAPIDNLFDPRSIKRALDLCCGCGALGLLSARVFKDGLDYVDLTDISESACEVAKKNCQDMGLQDVTNVYCGDLFGGVAKKAKPLECKYDLIVCQPPYERKSSLRDLPKECKAEPSIAFDGGKEGIDIIARVLKESLKFLSLPTNGDKIATNRHSVQKPVHRDDNEQLSLFSDVRYEYDVKRDGGMLILEIGDNLETLQKSYPSFEKHVTFLDTSMSTLEVVAISRSDIESLLGKRRRTMEHTENHTNTLPEIDGSIINSDDQLDEYISKFNEGLYEDDETDDNDDDDDDDDDDDIDAEELQRIIDMVNRDPQNIKWGESIAPASTVSGKEKGWTKKKVR